MKARNEVCIAMLLGFLLLTACKENPDIADIKANAQGYLEAMANYDVASAYPYASPQTQSQTLPTVDVFIKNSVDDSIIARNTPATINITKVTITDDSTAIVEYTKTTPYKKTHPTLTMRKCEMGWRAEALLSR